MTLPERIIVGPITYSVALDETDGEESGNQRTLGETNTAKQQIEVWAHQGPDQMRETLWHEVIHTVLEGLGIRHNEQLVVGLAMMTLDTLRRNPDLAAYLIAEE